MTIPTVCSFNVDAVRAGIAQRQEQRCYQQRQEKFLDRLTTLVAGALAKLPAPSVNVGMLRGTARLWAKNANLAIFCVTFSGSAASILFGPGISAEAGRSQPDDTSTNSVDIDDVDAELVRILNPVLAQDHITDWLVRVLHDAKA